MHRKNGRLCEQGEQAKAKKQVRSPQYTNRLQFTVLNVHSTHMCTAHVYCTLLPIYPQRMEGVFMICPSCNLKKTEQNIQLILTVSILHKQNIQLILTESLYYTNSKCTHIVVQNWIQTNRGKEKSGKNKISNTTCREGTVCHKMGREKK